VADPDVERILHGTILGDALLNAEIAALLADERGYYVAVNDYACELTEYSRERLTQLRAGELSADDSSRAIYEKVMRGQKMRGLKRVRCRTGRVVPCRYWGIPTVASHLPFIVVLLWPTRGAPPAPS
jgi:PAS domain S-box-containing protein